MVRQKCSGIRRSYLGKTDLTNKIDYIAPGEHKRLAVPAAAGKTVQWAAINDYGGTTKTETQTLQ